MLKIINNHRATLISTLALLAASAAAMASDADIPAALRAPSDQKLQRLETVGGRAPPSQTCSADSQASEARVPYTATYLFYAAAQAGY